MTIEYILIPGAALVGALGVFGIFVALFGKNPLDLYFYMYQGAFGTWFSWQNTLTRAAPLILTALCTALPAQLGMVIIGGEGALLIGALAATSAALVMQSAPPLVVQLAMVAAGMIGGGLWIMLSGGLRQYRGVNETISSLLLVYIPLPILHHLVEGIMPGPPPLDAQQAGGAGDRRRQHDRIDARHRRALRTGIWHRRRDRVLHPDLSHRVRLRRPRRRRQHSRRQDRGSRCRQADHDHLFPGGRLGRPCGEGRSRRRAAPHQRPPGGRLRLYRPPCCP